MPSLKAVSVVRPCSIASETIFLILFADRFGSF